LAAQTGIKSGRPRTARRNSQVTLPGDCFSHYRYRNLLKLPLKAPPCRT
jgi:hypothetical protein